MAGTPVRTTTYRHGNDVAVRFPEEWKLKPGELFEVTRNGDALVLRRVDEATPHPSAAQL